jgi:hypothetical protein
MPGPCRTSVRGGVGHSSYAAIVIDIFLQKSGNLLNARIIHRRHNRGKIIGKLAEQAGLLRLILFLTASGEIGTQGRKLSCR